MVLGRSTYNMTGYDGRFPSPTDSGRGGGIVEEEVSKT